MKSISDDIRAIKCDRVHGATWLSQKAVEVLIRCVNESEASALKGLLEELGSVAGKLMASRPAMVSISNCVARFVLEVNKYSGAEGDLGLFKEFAAIKAGEIIESLEQARLKAAELAAALIEENDSIMTCSYSSAVCQTFKSAWEKGKFFNIFALESRLVPGRVSYGEMVVAGLKDCGIPVRLVPDAAAEEKVLRVNKVVVGADGILADGSLVNGFPTGKLAKIASANSIPVYSVCETYKFDFRGSFKMETGFEKISPELVTGIVTEEGTVKPQEVSGFIREITELFSSL
ncbi:MAG: hypothetical protein H5T98_03575 [Syntrophomonadaceae bacterium]|nr:hypothetical protein [Syntrophomonadaceae bacterium]